MHHLTRLSLAHPKATLSLLGLVTLILGAGLPNVRSEYGYRVLIGDDHPSIRALDDFIGRFGGGLPVQIAWECGEGHPCGNVFDRTSLEMAQAVTETLASAAGVNRVYGPSNAPLIVPSPNGFTVRRFVENEGPSADVDALATLALEDPLWVGRLVSDDGSAAVIVVQPADSRDETSRQVGEAVERALRPYETHGFVFHLVGDPIRNLIGGRDLANSSSRLIPFTVTAIAIVLFVLSRSWIAVSASLATMGVALLWTFGLLGLLSWPRDGVLEVLAPLIMVVGVCDAIHMLSRCSAAEPPEESGQTSKILMNAARELAGPCLITTLTTAAAFLSFVTSDLATFIRFGSISAFGVISCLLLTFTLLPILVSASRLRGHRSIDVARAWNTGLEATLRASERRAVQILAASAVLLAVCGVGWLSYLRVDTDWRETLGDDSRVIRSIRFMETRLGQSSSLEVDIHLPANTRVEDPETLSRIEEFAGFLSSREGLGATRSIVDIVRRISQLLYGERAGGSAAANAETLELISFDDPDLLATWLSFDWSRLRLSVASPEQAYSTRRRVLDEVFAYAANHLPEDWGLVLSGTLAVQVDWTRDVQRTQIRSFPTALVLVFLMVAVFLRSIRLAIAAMVPTVLPIVITLGAMGWMGMSLDVGRAMIAAVLLGIAVDDSIHVLRQYRVRRDLGDDPREAIRNALLHTGRAVVTTSIALSLGFLTLMASAWQSIASFGFFVAIAILGALAATLFVLPALIFAFVPRSGSTAKRQPRPAVGRPHMRRLVGAAALLPLAGSLVGASLLAAGSTTERELPCWVLPMGHVLKAPGVGECPLQLLDQIRWVEDTRGRSDLLSRNSELRAQLRGADSDLHVGVLRAGDTRWVPVRLHERTPGMRVTRVVTAGLIAAVLMAIPLFLLWSSNSPAAHPLAFFCSTTGIVLVTGMAGRGSDWMSRLAIMALVAAPAALAHLSFVFPGDGRSLSRAPQLVATPYLLSGLLGAVAALALDRTPLLWPTFVYLLLALCAGGWAVLLHSCAFAMREPTSALARARARFVFFGTLFIPIALSLPLSWQQGVVENVAAYLWISALVMPHTIGFAISHYNLFDLGWRSRHAIARLLYLASGAVVAAALVHAALEFVELAHPLWNVGVLFCTTLTCLLVAELLRGPILGFLDARFAPRVDYLRRLRERYGAAMAELHDEDDVVRLLAETLSEGLSPRSGCVFLHNGGEWRPARLIGAAPPARTVLIEASISSLAGRALRHLSLETEREDAASRLLNAYEVEVVASIRTAGDCLGLVLLGSREGYAPYASVELDFLTVATSQAGIALHNARLAQEQAAIERHAATARLAVDLMHDVGKDLGWIRRLIARLATGRQPEERQRQRIAQIRDLTDSVVARMRAFVREATEPPDDPLSVLRLDELLDRSLRSQRIRYGEDRIRTSMDPDLRSLRCHTNLGRIVANLVENGIQASGPGKPVSVSAVREDDESLRIAVTDEGCGIPEELANMVMEAGFTTRRDQGGMGVGLSVARDMVEALDGKLELVRISGGGTRATIRVSPTGLRRRT